MSILRSPTPNSLKIFREAGTVDKLALILASWFGVAMMPVVPGTFGTLAAIPFAIAIAYLGPLAGACVLFLLILLAIWVSDRSARVLGKDDPAEVVIDEVVGLLLTLLLLPATGFNLFMGFILFRFFDILKPYPIRKLEKIGGGAGIVLDDLLAGVYANVCLRLLASAFGL